jgi:uncharacterized membrane protein YkvA (DUF1232 family)
MAGKDTKAQRTVSTAAIRFMNYLLHPFDARPDYIAH